MSGDSLSFPALVRTLQDLENNVMVNPFRGRMGALGSIPCFATAFLCDLKASPLVPNFERYLAAEWDLQKCQIS